MHQQVESSPLSIAQVQNHSQRYSLSNHDHNFRLIERACIHVASEESHTLIMILGIGGTHCSKSNEFPLNKAEKLPIYPNPGKMSPSNQEKHECKGKKNVCIFRPSATDSHSSYSQFSNFLKYKCFLIWFMPLAKY